MFVFFKLKNIHVYINTWIAIINNNLITFPQNNYKICKQLKKAIK